MIWFHALHDLRRYTIPRCWGPHALTISDVQSFGLFPLFSSIYKKCCCLDPLCQVSSRSLRAPSRLCLSISMTRIGMSPMSERISRMSQRISTTDPSVRTTERSPSARQAQARYDGLPPLVGPVGTSPVERRHSARAPESEPEEVWTPRRQSYGSTRVPASTPGLRSIMHRPKGEAERHSVDATIGITMLRHATGELRHATSTMGLTPSALQRLGASGETPVDSGDAADGGGNRRRPSGPPRYGMLGGAVRSRGNRCVCTAPALAPPRPSHRLAAPPS